MTKSDSPATQIAVFYPNPDPALSRGFGRTERNKIERTGLKLDKPSAHYEQPKYKGSNLITLKNIKYRGAVAS